MKILTVFFVLAASPVAAWDGYDYDKGAFVEIGKGNLVRKGETVEVFDYSKGEYKDMEVQNVRTQGRGAEVEVFDSDSGEYRTFDMD